MSHSASPAPRKQTSEPAAPTTVAPQPRDFAPVAPEAAEAEADIQASDRPSHPETGHSFGRLAARGPAGEDVVQRLIYLKPTKDLLVHKGYYERSIPKDGKNYPLIRQLPNDKQRNASVEDLYTDDDTKAEFLALVEKGLMLDDAVRTIDTPAVTADKVAGLNAQSKGDVNDALNNALQSYRKVLSVDQGVSYYTADSVQDALEWVLLPSDFIPEADDLVGSVGKTLTVHKDAQQNKWWKYACRLIALVKMPGGLDKAKEVTDDNSLNSLTGAVQALHDHYYNVNKKVMYDDTSSSTNLYPEWGYGLKFSGPCDLEDLPTKVALEAGDYIFDIHGHSVKAKVKVDIDGTTGRIDTDDLDDYFAFYSDGDNYEDDEKEQKVEYVWGK